MIELTSKVSVYVPSTLSVNLSIDTSDWIAKVAEFLSSNFGGATATEASGYWVSEVNGLVKEKVTIVYAYCSTEDLTVKKESIFALMQEMKTSLQQEAVSLELDNKLYLL